MQMLQRQQQAACVEAQRGFTQEELVMRMCTMCMRATGAAVVVTMAMPVVMMTCVQHAGKGTVTGFAAQQRGAGKQTFTGFAAGDMAASRRQVHGPLPCMYRGRVVPCSLDKKRIKQTSTMTYIVSSTGFTTCLQMEDRPLSSPCRMCWRSGCSSRCLTSPLTSPP